MANILLSNNNQEGDDKLYYSDFQNKYLELSSILREYKCCDRTLIIGDSESVIGLYITMLSALELDCSFCFNSELQKLDTSQCDEIFQLHVHIIKVRLLSTSNIRKVDIEEKQQTALNNKNVELCCGGVYFFTSGSTGLPKIIFHDTKTLKRMVETFTLLYPQGVHYTTTPPISLGSVQFLMLALHLQIPYIIGGSLEEAIFQLKSSHIQPVIFTHPSLLIDYTLSANNYHTTLHLLKEINLGGEPILESDVLAMSKIFSCQIRWAYGSAEVGPLAEGIGFQDGQAVYALIEGRAVAYAKLRERESGEIDIVSTVNTFNSGYISGGALKCFGAHHKTGDFAKMFSQNHFFLQDRSYKDFEDNELIKRLNTQLNMLGKQHLALFFRIVTVNKVNSQIKLRVICFFSDSGIYNDIVDDLNYYIDRDILEVKCYSQLKLLKNGKLDLQYYS
ncbi:hypothetical protein BMR04_13470 [Methylococcaceae bacterium HT3]|nr:hypothetical protein BMR04_13470 [Methylococcaceae bacterium HT3]